MIKRILNKAAASFGKKYTYNTDYMHDVINASASAGIRLTLWSLLSQYRGPNTDLWAGAVLASTLDGDCGPCAQLVIDMAIEAGVSPQDLRDCLERQGQTPTSVGLGYRFSKAVILDTPDADELREEVKTSFGDQALVAASFAASLGRAYPVMKRGLGHGKTCMTLRIGNEDNVPVLKAG